MKEETHGFEVDELIMCSTRYFLGRRTISTTCFARNLAKVWNDLSERVQVVIKRDIEDAFRDDDIDRKYLRDIKRLGDDCDRAAWEEVRDAW